MNFPIPETFARIETDTLDDISRKLDKGVDLLKDIKGDTGVLHEHTGLLKDITGRQDKLVEGQDKLVDGQNKMIEILEKISEK